MEMQKFAAYAAVGEATYCATHATVETQLRCNRCARLICLKCAVLTPVGYRCKDCVRTQQAVYFTAGMRDEAMVFVASFIMTFIAAPLVAVVGEMLYFGGIYVALLSGPGAGALFAGVVRMVTGRRRSRHTAHLMIAGVVTAMIIGVIVDVVVFGGLVVASPVMWIFVFLAATTAYSMMK